MIQEGIRGGGCCVVTCCVLGLSGQSVSLIDVRCMTTADCTGRENVEWGRCVAEGQREISG